MEPMKKSCSGSKITRFFSATGPILSYMPCQVPSVAKTGRSYLRESMPMPLMWSACSWVTSMASRRRGSMPMRISSWITRVPDMPASTRMWASSQPT